MNVRMVKRAVQNSEHSGCVSAGGDGKKGVTNVDDAAPVAAGAVSLAGRYHAPALRCDAIVNAANSG